MPYEKPPNGPGRCEACGRPVLWTTTSANRLPMAVDHPIDATGNQAVHVDGDGHHWTRQLNKERPTPETGEVLHRPHISTCPARRPRTTPTPRRPTGVRPHRWQR